jgi:uncharacterized membrane protein
LTGTGAVAAWGAAFVATHLLLSHPLRAPIAARTGARGFMILYSLVALVTFVGMVVALRSARAEAPLWSAPRGLWDFAALLMWFAAILLAGSFRRNPAMETVGRTQGGATIAAPLGVQRITRHPMMWSFAIWAIVHIALIGRPADIALGVTILVMALVGAAGQDRKKAALLGEQWTAYESQTSFVPFGRGLASPGLFALIVGTLIFLVATRLHPIPVGVWQWI